MTHKKTSKKNGNYPTDHLICIVYEEEGGITSIPNTNYMIIRFQPESALNAPAVIPLPVKETVRPVSENKVQRHLASTLKDWLFPAFPKIYPNPLRPGQAFTLEWKSGSNEELSIKVRAADSHLLSIQPFKARKGVNRFVINTDIRWKPGVYFIEIFSGSWKEVKAAKLLIE